MLCSRCYLRDDLCLCHQAPALTDRVHLLLVTHERECVKPNNTGRLLDAALLNAELMVWQRKLSDQLIAQVAKAKQLSPVLLFPGDDMSAHSSDKSVVTELDGEMGDVDKTLFVILDGTWQQAAKMVRQSPQLQSLPRFVLPSSLQSRYLLRKNQQLGNLSTVETGMALLTQLGFECDAQALGQYFEQFLRNFEANRSGHCAVNS